MKGKLNTYFETGTEGSYWAIYDESKKNKDGFLPHSAMKILKNGDFLKIYVPGTDQIYWEGKIELLDIVSHIMMRNDKFKKHMSNYVQQHEDGSEQFCLAGRWVHAMPINIDLAVWYKIMISEEDWYGEVKKVK